MSQELWDGKGITRHDDINAERMSSNIRNQRQEIESLRQQLADATESYATQAAEMQDAWRRNEELLVQLAASQAREQQLREYLHRLACLGNGAHYGTSDGNRIAQVALALQQDTTALQAMIAKAGEVMRERAAQEGWMAANGNCEDRVRRAILSIANVTLFDLK